VNPESVGATAKVFAPAKIWDPVDTSPRAVRDASGRLNVWTHALDTILKFVPAVPMANVWVVFVSPFRDPILLLNVFQSVAESAPVVVALARARESPVPTRESQFVGERIERAPCLLLNTFQSVPVSAPVVVEFAFQIENTPVVLLYERGQSAEREVRPILVATTHERVERFVLVVVRFPERVDILPVAVARLVVRVAILPVAVARFVWRVAILPVAVERLVVVRVLVPWSFWIAWRTESLAVTVPAAAENPVRTDQIVRALVK
jgi:hypothetical protein